MVKKSKAIVTCLIICLGVAMLFGAVGTALGIVLSADSKKAAEGTTGAFDILDEVAQIARERGLWTPEDNEKLVNNAADAILYGERDIYSDYMNAEEWAEYTEEAEGKYHGIGVRVQLDVSDGLVKVINVYANGPAEAAGVKRGDKILKINGESMPLNDIDAIKEKVRGDIGTTVDITFLRDSEEITLSILRDAVVSPNCEYRMLDDKIGYIKIYEFQGNANILFQEALTTLKSKGMQALLIDLRDNPGGDKSMVCDMIDTLVPEGDIITMRDKDGNVVERDTSDKYCLGIPMAVLTNENTASAAELMSGDLKDYKVATVIGVTTYGKGVGQSYVSLSNGGVVRLTAFEYCTASGFCPQDKGITPDMTVEMSDEVKKDSLLWCTDKDVQYTTAYELLKGKVN